MGPIPREELAQGLRRTFERYEFNVAAEIAWHSKNQWGRVKNISRSGMFIEMLHPPEVGRRVFVRLALNTPLELECTVRRVAPRSGAGVSLTVPQRAKRRFEALLLALGCGLEPLSASVSIPQQESPRTMVKAAGALNS